MISRRSSTSNFSNASASTSGSNKKLKPSQPRSVQTSIQNYIGRNILPCEEDRFNTLLLRMTVSNGWAFHWVENEETLEFFKFIAPLLKLPSRQKLSDTILKDSVKECQREIENMASMDKIGVTISLDGWKNVLKQNILGLVVIRSDGQVLVWGAQNISGHRGDTNEAVNQISNFIQNSRSKNVNINAVVTDSASAYTAAR